MSSSPSLRITNPPSDERKAEKINIILGLFGADGLCARGLLAEWLNFDEDWSFLSN
jgi:hypothetical protein